MKKYKFIEEKKIDIDHIKGSILKCYKVNKFANYGPVTKKLENKISRLLNLKSRSVIMCSSATAGIQTLTNFFQRKSSKKIRWIISNNAFYSSNVQNLYNSKIIDSSPTGAICLSSLKKVNINSWDGIIYTNTYAFNYNWSSIRKYCLDNNKYFIIDNATGLLDRPVDSKIDYEIISFHHTKPWGFGEGGAIICPNKNENIIRSLINFGSSNFSELKKFSNNYKISEISSMFILQRLNKINHWKRNYLLQEKSIRKIIKDNKFKISVLGNKTSFCSPRSYIPLILNKKISLEKLKKIKLLVLNKYYLPILKSKKFKNSVNIYERIVCFPNNPDLLEVNKSKIKKALIDLQK